MLSEAWNYSLLFRNLSSKLSFYLSVGGPAFFSSPHPKAVPDMCASSVGSIWVDISETSILVSEAPKTSVNSKV